MKILKLGFSILMMLFMFGCGSKVEITNGDLVIQINDKMQMKVLSTNKQTQAYYSDFVTSDYLVAREFKADKFLLSDIRSHVEGENKVFELVGVYNKDGFEIEKHVTITISEKFANSAYFDIKYVNKGEKTATVTSWVNHHLRVKQSKTDNPIWSLQTTSTIRRDDWVLPVVPGFYQKNFMGMNNSDYGGGIPVVNLWREDGGIMIGVTEMTPKLFSTPVEMGLYDGYASMSILKEYDNVRTFKTDDVIETYSSFITVHTGDFFEPLKKFSHYMQAQGLEFVDSEPLAYEAVWCAWGYERTFTIDEVIGTLPKVKELGFKWVDVDDGFQKAIGDWEPNDRFPGGNKDMRRLADAIRAHGLRPKLWWAPLAAHPNSEILADVPEMQLRTRHSTPQYITWWNSYYLSPVNPYTQAYTRDLVELFLDTWDFDGLKMDGQHLNAVPPDYNRHSGLAYAEQAFEELPMFFKDIYETAIKYKPNAVIQNCPCGCAMNFFNMPYMNQAVSSDPLSSWQIRLKGKVYRAIFNEIAYYADHVELSDNGDDFPTQIGIGAVVGSKFTWPKDNPNVEKSYLLTPEKEVFYKKWVGIYNEKMLSKGDYLGSLYDLTFDKPETHAIKKDGKMYYAFYADEWNGESIELRGLKNQTYVVNEYTSDEGVVYEVDGSNPIIHPTFKRAYLIEVYPKQ